MTLQSLRKCTILLAKGTRSPIDFYLCMPLWELDEWAGALMAVYKEIAGEGGI